MDNKYDLIDLQRAANYLMVQNKLRPSGISGIVFGALALFGGWGVASIQDQILVLLGLFLIFEGIWVLAWPSANGILMNSIGIAAVGVYNIAISYMPDSQSSWTAFGILQLYWGYTRYKEYRMYKAMTVFPPSAESYKFMKSLIRDIETIEAESSSNMIIFQLGGVIYRAILMDRSAVLLSADKKVIIVWNRHDVDLSKIQETDESRNVRVSGSIINDTVAMLPDVYYNRLEAWMNGSQLYSSGVIVRRYLKQRTIVLAQVLLTLSIGALIITIFEIISAGIAKYFIILIIMLVISITPLVLWNKLLRMQSWAWTTLVIIESVLSLIGTAAFLWMLFRKISEPAIHMPWGFYGINFLVVAGLFYLPLIMLITDRPSGWRRTESIQPVPEMEIV